jgi:hypothetical protein
MNDQGEPIDSYQFGAQRLFEEHPPRWTHWNKQVVHEIASPPGSIHRGTLEYSRWAAMPLPESVDTQSAATLLRHQPGFFDYAPAPDQAGLVVWYVNFADPHLFVAYGSSLFAQDEMQVVEHPALGSLKEALDASKIPAVTVDRDEPTPVLVLGVERRCRVATDPNTSEGRPHGLYGNAFARADAETIKRATIRIDPPTLTNLISMASLAVCYGRYRVDEIEYVLRTAYTAFRAAVMESTRSRGTESPVAVHTGFWGCGAFGGHRVLMTILQIIAAEMAGMDRIVFHTGDSSGDAAIDEARQLFEEDLVNGSPVSVRALMTRIESIGFEWGVSDGN